MTNDHNQHNYLVNIEEQALDFLRDYALLAYISITIGASLIAYLLYDDMQSTGPIYWIAFIWITQTASCLYRRKLPKQKNSSHKAKLLKGTLINTLDGILICSCLIFTPFISNMTYMIIINSLIIACTCATITTIGYRDFYLGFSSPIMLSVIVSSSLSAFLMGGSNYLYVVSAITILLAYVLYTVSNGIFNNFKSAFISNLKNIEVNKELHIAIDKAKKSQPIKDTLFGLCKP